MVSYGYAAGADAGAVQRGRRGAERPRAAIQRRSGRKTGEDDHRGGREGADASRRGDALRARRAGEHPAADHRPGRSGRRGARCARMCAGQRRGERSGDRHGREHRRAARHGDVPDIRPGEPAQRRSGSAQRADAPDRAQRRLRAGLDVQDADGRRGDRLRGDKPAGGLLLLGQDHGGRQHGSLLGRAARRGDDGAGAGKFLQPGVHAACAAAGQRAVLPISACIRAGQAHRYRPIRRGGRHPHRAEPGEERRSGAHRLWAERRGHAHSDDYGGVRGGQRRAADEAISGGDY